MHAKQESVIPPVPGGGDEQTRVTAVGEHALPSTPVRPQPSPRPRRVTVGHAPARDRPSHPPRPAPSILARPARPRQPLRSASRTLKNEPQSANRLRQPPRRPASNRRRTFRRCRQPSSIGCSSSSTHVLIPDGPDSTLDASTRTEARGREDRSQSRRRTCAVRAENPQQPAALPRDTMASDLRTQTQLDISRAPSPAEARPIKAIPVPEDWVPCRRATGRPSASTGPPPPPAICRSTSRIPSWSATAIASNSSSGRSGGS